MPEGASNWSKESCMGYTMAAMRNLGYDEVDITKLILEMTHQFRFKTPKEAAEYYWES
ncbi:hypothetical protein [Sporolactobacillus laevolacticus]|uniref:Uncharacterized protein n=1 Tax=Sporolactobacillus laevolacticus DSM 442 TaxID=1395513 RepID=V6IXF3_9BACL|nr:hypothetical protein [Sporolactobacillus laevolacticus]EST12068.1 hypothetical protein P343_08140 [Sporolactobacillus laevolacticus DSM 442]